MRGATAACGEVFDDDLTWGEDIRVDDAPPKHEPAQDDRGDRDTRAELRECRAHVTWRGYDVTPHRVPWRRRVYERVVRPFWLALVAGLRPVDDRGRLAAREVLARLPEALRAHAESVAAADLEAYLDAQGCPFEEAVGPIVRGCVCRACARERRRAATERQRPRDERVRAAFLDEAINHLQLVLGAPNRYDRRLGVPALSWSRRRGAGRKMEEVTDAA